MKTSSQKKTLMRNTLSKAFICGCGKNYSSEPSLYTHEKNKHDGIRQLDTQIPTVKQPIEKSKGRPISKPFKSNNTNPSNLSINSQPFPDYQQTIENRQNEYNIKCDSPISQENHFSNQFAIQMMHYYFSQQTRKNILEMSNSVHQSSNNIVSEEEIDEIIFKNYQNFGIDNLSSLKHLIQDFQKLTLFITTEQRAQWIDDFVFTYFFTFTNSLEIETTPQQQQCLQQKNELIGIIDNFKKSLLTI